MEISLAELAIEPISPINRLPAEVFHDIFILSLPTSYPEFSEGTQISTYITSAAPHNFARVCRSWRDIVLSNPWLWSTFFHSLHSPTTSMLEIFIDIIEQHLHLSGNLPLTCFVRLQGEYDMSVSDKIVDILAAHQRRWRRIGFHFTDNHHPPYCYNDINNFARGPYDFDINETPAPIPEVNLFIEELGMLEELHINFADEYVLTDNKSSRAGHPVRLTLPSFTHLDMEATCDRTVIHWLSAAAHLTELVLTFNEPYYYVGYSDLLPIELPELRIIRVANPGGLGRGDAELQSAAAKFVLRAIVCPMLQELYLCLNCEAEDEFYRFFLWGVHHLQILDITVDLRVDPFFQPFAPTPASPCGEILDSLPLIPSLRELKMRCYELDSEDISDILEALTRMQEQDPSGSDRHTSLDLLPALEILDLDIIVSKLLPDPSKFINLIEARWSAHEKTFTSFTLLYRSVALFQPFQSFSSQNSKRDLPSEWGKVGPFISDGLQLRIV